MKTYLKGIAIRETDESVYMDSYIIHASIRTHPRRESLNQSFRHIFLTSLVRHFPIYPFWPPVHAPLA